MLLTEIDEGDELFIKSYYYDKTTYGDAEVNFRTTCTEILNRGILTNEMTTDDGNPINFESDKVCSDVYLIREGECPIIWKNAMIKRFTIHGERIHAIASKLEGIKFNRRGSFRISVGARGIARLGVSRTTADVIVKDISLSGFAIIIEPKYEVRQFDYMRVTFDDYGYRINVTGVCIRHQPLPDGRIIYACTIDAKNPDLEDYIAAKQLALARARSQT